MASIPETLTSNQFQQARTRLWHQNGNALRTQDDARAWLDEAGLVPYYPHAQFAAPQGSFAEAVLGRPENGWIPQEVEGISGEESYAAEVEDEEPDDAVADADELDELDESDTENDPVDPEAADSEIMLSDDDEFAEDEGGEIAEEDRIHASGDPVPNDLQEAATPVPEPINGFSAEERETVRRTLARMVAEGIAVPLNLLGSSSSEPDFICSAQAFSFIYTLRGDKGWKQEPAQTGSMRVSPLAAKVYAALKDKGAMTPSELAQEIEHGIVESAVVRALSELWSILRVIPLVSTDGQPERWEVLTAHHIRHVKAGANAGLPTALSALLSLYLAQVLAASGEEMEVFLSPLAARSRIREVVSALAASRQLEQIVVEGKTLLYIPGTLENLPASEPDQQAAPAVMPRSRYEDDDRRAMLEARRAREAEAGPQHDRRPYDRTQRGSDTRPERGGGERRPSFGNRSQGGFSPQRRSSGSSGAPREGGFAPKSDDRERRPFQRRDDASGPPRPRNEFARPWNEERGPREDRLGSRPPYPPRDGERRPSAYNRPTGDRKPFTPRSGEDRPDVPRGADRPYAPRPFTPNNSGERRPSAYGRPAGDRPRDDRKPFTPREGGGERRSFTPREDNGERRPYAPRGDRPFTPRNDRPFQSRGDRPFTPRAQRNDGTDRPFAPSEGSESRPFQPRGDRPFTPRGDRPFTPRGDRPFTPRADRPFTPRDGRPFTPRGDRPFTPRSDRPFTPRGDRPFTPREGGERKPFGARRPYSGARTDGPGERPNRDRFSGEPGEGRPSFKAAGGKSAGPGGAKFGGSGFGRDRKGSPGSYGKPGFSPARRGPGSGPGRGGAPKRRPE